MVRVSAGNKTRMILLSEKTAVKGSEVGALRGWGVVAESCFSETRTCLGWLLHPPYFRRPPQNTVSPAVLVSHKNSKTVGAQMHKFVFLLPTLKGFCFD